MSVNPSPCVPILTIAGSDSGGGAGIQADLKTIQALGGYGMSAITAITAQNTQGVFGVQPVSLEIIRQQIELVLNDIGASAVKTGMLATAEIIEVVASSISSYISYRADPIHPACGGGDEGKYDDTIFTPTVYGGGKGGADNDTTTQTMPPLTSPPQAGGIGIPLIIDPVMVAKGGASLLAADAVQALITKLLPLATVVTPNIPEAETLSGRSIATKSDMQGAARAILAHGVQVVIIKGGHLDTGDGLVHNLLVSRDGLEIWQSTPRIHTRNTHGTGCTFSAAMATLLGKGLSLEESFKLAIDYVAGAIAHAPSLGKGHGPLNHGWQLVSA